MFDIGWTELMLIGIVALIVIGPKDLPDMFRTLGRFTAKARGMAREFSRAMESAADEAGVKDIAKDLKNATSARSMGLDAVKDAAAKFEKWDPMKATSASAATPKPDPSAPAKPQTPAKPPVAASESVPAKPKAAPKPAKSPKSAASAKTAAANAPGKITRKPAAKKSDA